MTELNDQHIDSETLNDDYDSPWKEAIGKYSANPFKPRKSQKII